MTGGATPPADALVWVRRQWNDTRRAAYRFGDVERLHWAAVSGGVGQTANHPYVHGYVWCDGAVEGEVPHSCRHGQGPHRIKVCVVAVDNGGARSPLVRYLRSAASGSA